MKFQPDLWQQKKLSTCFPESVSKKASEEAKNSKNSEEYFGREFAYKKKGLSEHSYLVVPTVRLTKSSYHHWVYQQ